MNIEELRKFKTQKESDSFYVSFSDLLMLLCVFFILIIGISKVEVGSFEKIKSGFSGSTEGTLVKLAGEIKHMVEKDPGIPNVKVKLTKQGVLIDLKTAALFESGSSVLKVDTLAPMKIILDKIKGTNYKIDIEGHSDDQGYYRKNGDQIETNWSLSAMRGASVLHYILGFGVRPDRLRLVGYSNNRPKVSIEHLTGVELENARAENRRVSLLIR